MKKFISILLAVMMIFGTSVFAFAADSSSINAYVTISDRGSLVVSVESITVTDIDKDGKFTINDVLYCAHEKFYDGGAADGYESYTHETYGLSLRKLWGQTNSGSFGYYVNNKSAWSLADTVKSGDYVYAFNYSDAKTYTDSFAYFDKFIINEDGNTVELTLTVQNGYDSSWNPVFVPLEGATITVDGKDTGVKTDKNGKATVTLSGIGDKIISAKAPEGKLITPPACKVVDNGIVNTIINAIKNFISTVVNLIKNFIYSVMPANK
jgi:hypothetical protein